MYGCMQYGIICLVKIFKKEALYHIGDTESMVLCYMPHQISRIFINVSLSQTRHEHTTATQSCSDFLLNGYQNVLLLKSNCDSQLLPIIHGWSITHKSIKKLYQLENCSRVSKYDLIENKHKPYLGPKRGKLV